MNELKSESHVRARLCIILKGIDAIEMDNLSEPLLIGRKDLTNLGLSLREDDDDGRPSCDFTQPGLTICGLGVKEKGAATSLQLAAIDPYALQPGETKNMWAQVFQKGSPVDPTHL